MVTPFQARDQVCPTFSTSHMAEGGATSDPPAPQELLAWLLGPQSRHHHRSTIQYVSSDAALPTPEVRAACHRHCRSG
jgi:hypothetical protein